MSKLPCGAPYQPVRRGHRDPHHRGRAVGLGSLEMALATPELAVAHDRKFQSASNKDGH